MKFTPKRFAVAGCLGALLIGLLLTSGTLVFLWWSDYFEDPAKVPGTYIAVCGQGKDTLEVHPNGTYDQTFVDNMRVTTCSGGTWTWGRPNQVTLFGLYPRIDTQGHYVPSVQPVTAGFGFETSWGGKRRLQFGEDPASSYNCK